MAEDLVISNGNKENVYQTLLPQIKALVGDEENKIAILANVAAAIHQSFDNLWTGFYLVEEKELVLGPFQGPVACTRIQFGKGVCGSSWKEERTLIVEDVDSFPGHIACSSLSKSEIVVPILKENRVIGVLDIDSKQLSTFDEIDEQHLTELCLWLGTRL